MLAVYNHDGEPEDADKLSGGVDLIPLLEFRGVRVSSRHVEIDFRLTQAMILEQEDDEPSPQRCLITKREPVEENPAPGGAVSGVDLTEASLAPPSSNITIQDREEVMKDIYRDACKRAKELNKAAIEARLKAWGIRDRYDLGDLEESDDDERVVEPLGGV